jgi:pyrimidine-nucleoside phosphorylase
MDDKYFNPTYKRVIKAPKSGYVNYFSTKTIGLTSFYLGAGRIRKEDSIDYHAGIYLNKICNEYVQKGEVVGTLYSSKPIKDYSVIHFTKNLQINNKPIKMEPMIEKVMK